MSLSKRQEAYLSKIVGLVEKVRAEAEKASNPRAPARTRRSREDTEKMRKAVLAARAKGVSAAELAEKFGVSMAYIYMIKK